VDPAVVDAPTLVEALAEEAEALVEEMEERRPAAVRPHTPAAAASQLLAAQAAACKTSAAS
jgi:hypothetical protein